MNAAREYNKEVEQVVTMLAQSKHANVLLVGQRGVQSMEVASEAVGRFESTRVFLVNLEDLMTGTVTGIEQLQHIGSVLLEMEREHGSIAILTGMEGVFEGIFSISAEDILYPFFASNSVRTIALLSDEECQDLAQLSQSAHTVRIRGLSADRTRELLQSMVSPSVSQEFVAEVVARTEHLFPDVPYPKRALDIINELNMQDNVKPHHVTKYISKKVAFDIQRVTDEGDRNLENILAQRIVNQRGAQYEILQGLVRARSKRIDMNHPIASFLFAGPRGVGKTETARALAQAYYGSREQIVRVNLEKDLHTLPSVITANPFCVLLLDGYDEAPRDVRVSTLPALHRGYITDAFGRKYFTTHMLIIAMSKQGIDQQSGHEREPFQNFDGVIPFTSLTPKHVREIARRKLAALNGRLQISYDVSLEVTPELIDYIARAGYTDDLGAHKMDRCIEETVEHAAMQAITRDMVVPGGKLRIDPQRFPVR